ncbi:site-2 protease family protein [Candidatus Woesearchaeota archaeon]|nr:site-2 protease family protein [Candidatus Woesearchaeota archaeon]
MRIKSVRLGKILGIDIELHYTWFLIFALLAWALSAGFFPHYYPDLTKTEYWIIGSAASILLFVSVLLHELTHSFVALRNRISVKKITLFFFGGVAQISDENITPSKEFKMAIAGPLMSLLLAAVFYLVTRYSAYLYISAIAFYLTRLNLILAIFNLVPGYPLDGGRALRAFLWGYYKDIKKATKYAASGGKIFGIILATVGILGMFLGLGTIWFVLIGIFIYFLAGMGYEQVVIKDVLSKIKVKQVMVKDFISVKPSTTIAKLFSNYFLRYSQDVFPVVEKNRLLGIVTAESINMVPKRKWMTITAEHILTPLKAAAKEDDNAYKTLMRMSSQKIGLLPIIKNKRLKGIVSIPSLLRCVRLKVEVD